MGGFFSKFRIGEKAMNVVMVGLDGAGKTTIVLKFKGAPNTTTSPTLGFNVDKIIYKKAKFAIWDLGGQEKYRYMWKDYFNDVQALIYVVDSDDRARIQEASTEFQNILLTKELVGVPILIFANKSDKPGSMFAHEIVGAFGLNSVSDRKWHVQSSCALNFEGLPEGLNWLHENI
ncbi:ADP-ribosylation factor 6 [Pelomyxa schiedti]|nr:ADP-ribosylation factor 6 [Pelomyxa schiedti]